MNRNSLFWMVAARVSTVITPYTLYMTEKSDKDFITINKSIYILCVQFLKLPAVIYSHSYLTLLA